MNPTVSVVIPTYNRGNKLSQAIDSVLGQTMGAYELIVVDDGSNDDTESVVKSYSDARIKYLNHTENLGAGAARNTGIRYANGEFISFLDSDDTWDPKKLEKQIDRLRELPSDYIAIYCDVRIQRNSILKSLIDILFANETLNGVREELIAKQLSFSGFLHAGSTLTIKSSILDKSDLFREDMSRQEEIEFVIRYLYEGQFEYLNDTLVTLYDTGNPDPQDVIDSIKKLQDLLEDEICHLENNGYNIVKSQHLILSRQYFRRGEFNSGIDHLIKSKPSTARQVVGLLYDIYRGLITRSFFG